VPFNRRTRFILTAALALGYGATLVPTWFTYVFTYDGGNHALSGFYDAIVLVMETGFAVTAFVAMFLNLILPDEIEDIPEATPETPAYEKGPQGSIADSLADSLGESSKVAVPSKEVV